MNNLKSRIIGTLCAILAFGFINAQTTFNCCILDDNYDNKELGYEEFTMDGKSGNMNHIKKGDVLYVFGDRVNVRDTFGLGGKVVGKLAIGQTVRLVDWTEEYDLKVQGYGDRWYKIEAFDLFGKEVVGYVWGGLFAKSWMFADINNDWETELVMLGVSGKPNVGEETADGEVRIMKNGFLLQEKPIQDLCVAGFCESETSLKIIQDKNLSDGMRILEASITTPGVQDIVVKSLLFWNGEKLEEITQYQNVYSSLTGINESPIYPSDEAGQDNQIIVQRCTAFYNKEDGGSTQVCSPIKTVVFENDQIAKVVFPER